jgi:hypothetical protein
MRYDDIETGEVSPGRYRTDRSQSPPPRLNGASLRSATVAVVLVILTR